VEVRTLPFRLIGVGLSLSNYRDIALELWTFYQLYTLSTSKQNSNIEHKAKVLMQVVERRLRHQPPCCLTSW
jgi:hypothetical protein